MKQILLSIFEHINLVLNIGFFKDTWNGKTIKFNSQLVHVKNGYKRVFYSIGLFFTCILFQPSILKASINDNNNAVAVVAVTNTISTAVSGTLCNGSTISYDGNTIPGATYAWEIQTFLGWIPLDIAAGGGDASAEDYTGGIAWAPGGYPIRRQATVAGTTYTSNTLTLTITGSLGTATGPVVDAGTDVQSCNSAAVNIIAGSSATRTTGTTWTSNGTGVIANATSLTTATYTPSAADISAGSVTLTLTGSSSSCGSAYATKTLTFASAPTATAGGSKTICQPGTATVSGATSSNGTISWTDNGSGSITSGATTLTPTYTAAAGDNGNTVTLTMTVSNGTCTPATATYSVIVATPVVNPITGNLNVCVGGTTALSSTTTGGVWSSATTTKATINGSTGVVTGVAAGTSVISYIVTSGTCSTTKTATVTVTSGVPAGTAVIAGASAICENSSNQVYTVSGVTGATGYTWSVPADAAIISGSGTNSITVDMGTTTGTISVVPFNVCGNATGATLGSKTITVNLTNAATIAYASSTYCTSTSTAQTVTRTGTTGGTYSYTSSPGGGTLGSFSTSTGSFIPSTSSASRTYTIVYTMPATACATATTNTTVTIASGVPTGTAAIAGTATICENSSNQVYTVTGVTGATGYTWSVPADAAIISGSGTNSITVDMGSTTGAISVVPYNACGNATGGTRGSKTVTVNLTNAATIVYAASTYCTSTSTAQTVTRTGTTGGTYSYTSSPGGGTLGSFSTSTGSFVPSTSSTSRTYTIVYTMPATACATATTNTTVTITSGVPTGTASISGTSPVCQNTSQVYTVTGVTGATGYTWNVPADATITSGSGTNSITVTMGATTSSTISVVPYNVCGNATGVTLGSKTVTVNLTNAATIAYASSTYCTSTSTAQTVTRTGTTGGTYSYTSSPAGGTLGSFSTSTGSFVPSTSTTSRTYTIVYTMPATTCATATTNTSVTVFSCSNAWTGNSGTDWATNTNWIPATVPTSTADVIIPASVVSGNMPAISTTGNVKSLTNNGTITFASGGALNVYGNISNTGTITPIAGTSVSLLGATAQTITGVPALYDVVVNNTSGGVSLSSAITLKGTLTLTNGALTTNSNLTINFDNGGNIANSGSGTISGNVSGRRDAVAKTHYIAAPFVGVTSAQVLATTPLFANSYYKMYAKDFTSQNWTAVTNTTTAMPVGTGFSLSMPAAAPLIFTGTYSKASVTGATYSNATAGYFLMIGNPYPSTLDWSNASGWSKTNVGGAIYYWDATNSRVASWISGPGGSVNLGTQYVPAMQAFLVATTGSGGSSSVSVNNNARLTTNASYWREAMEDMDIIRLTLIADADNEYSDEAVIRFSEMATENFDYELDAYKILNTGLIPSLYTNSGTDMYSINTYSSVDSTKYIPVAAKLPVDGTYKLKISGNNPNIDYILVDKLLSTQQSIYADSAYAFTGLRTDNVNRFELQLRVSAVAVPTGVQSANKNGGLDIFSSTKGFVIKTDRYAGEEAEIEILDITGNSIKVISGKNLSMGSTYVPLDMADGSYLIKVNVKGNAFAGMVVLTK